MLPAVRTEICAVPSRVREESREGGGGRKAFNGGMPPTKWPIVGETRLDKRQLSGNILWGSSYRPSHSLRLWAEKRSATRAGVRPQPSHMLQSEHEANCFVCSKESPLTDLDKIVKRCLRIQDRLLFQTILMPSYGMEGGLLLAGSILNSPKTKGVKSPTDYAKCSQDHLVREDLRGWHLQP